MSVGEKIKEYVNSRGIKQAFIAEQANISTVALSNMLNGNQKIDALTYHDICKALQVPMEQFFED